jgi:hypothetical protein
MLPRGKVTKSSILAAIEVGEVEGFFTPEYQGDLGLLAKAVREDPRKSFGPKDEIKVYQ